jgi:glycosyltransferase involved in cell wall biosynthesis
MSSYNHGKYLSEAIESVLNQTFSDLELVIVDDYSTDNSREIIESYQAKDTRVKAIFHPKNFGIARTANDTIKVASGKFIAFISSDDVWFPNKLERQIQALENSQDMIVWADGEVINSAGTSIGLKVTTRMNAPAHRSGNLFEELLRDDIIFGQTVIMKREFVNDSSFNESFHYVNDHLFFVEQAKNHQFLFLDESLAKYRIHGNNVSLKNEELWNKEKILIRKLFLKRYGLIISRDVLADIYYKMAYAFSHLGDKTCARRFYLRAIQASPIHTSSVLFLILALTNGDGFLGKLLPTFYQKMVSYLKF